MIKKILALALSALMCLSLFALVSCDDREEGEANGDPNRQETSSVTYIGEDGKEHTLTEIGNSDLKEKLYSVPDEILNGTTEELLEFFVDSYFAKYATVIAPTSQDKEPPKPNYLPHPAFQELITRPDLYECFLPCIDAYNNGYMTGFWEAKIFNAFVMNVPEELRARFEAAMN